MAQDTNRIKHEVEFDYSVKFREDPICEDCGEPHGVYVKALGEMSNLVAEVKLDVNNPR